MHFNSFFLLLKKHSIRKKSVFLQLDNSISIVKYEKT